MAIRNYTSKVSAAQTMGQIQQRLGEYGAQRIALDYEGGQPVAIEFFIDVSGRVMSYRLEADVPGMLRAMEADSDVPNSRCKPEQAERTTWKNLLDWIDAQLALETAGQARLEQLLLGYAVTETGETLYENMIGGPHGQLLLPGDDE